MLVALPTTAVSRGGGPVDFSEHGYEFEEYVGKGQFGRAIRVRHIADKSQWVAKIIDLSVLDERDKLFSLQEAAVMQTLNHPGIVGWRESFLHQDTYLVIIMEYCEDGDLASQLDDRRRKILRSKSKTNKLTVDQALKIDAHGTLLAPATAPAQTSSTSPPSPTAPPSPPPPSSSDGVFSEAEIISTITQLAEALHYLHSRNILHRDIKPHNIFLTGAKSSGSGSDDGGLQVKIGDFGISRLFAHPSGGSQGPALASTAVGTPQYMAPEMCESQPYTYKTDIWAFGCVAYEMATLRPAFDGTSFLSLVVAISTKDPPPLSNAFSRELRRLISRLLAKSPQERPSAGDILREPIIQKFRLRHAVEHEAFPAGAGCPVGSISAGLEWADSRSGGARPAATTVIGNKHGRRKSLGLGSFAAAAAPGAAAAAAPTVPARYRYVLLARLFHALNARGAFVENDLLRNFFESVREKGGQSPGQAAGQSPQTGAAAAAAGLSPARSAARSPGGAAAASSVLLLPPYFLGYALDEPLSIALLVEIIHRVQAPVNMAEARFLYERLTFLESEGTLATLILALHPSEWQEPCIPIFDELRTRLALDAYPTEAQPIVKLRLLHSFGFFRKELARRRELQGSGAETHATASQRSAPLVPPSAFKSVLHIFFPECTAHQLADTLLFAPRAAGRSDGCVNYEIFLLESGLVSPQEMRCCAAPCAEDVDFFVDALDEHLFRKLLEDGGAAAPSPPGPKPLALPVSNVVLEAIRAGGESTPLAAPLAVGAMRHRASPPSRSHTRGAVALKWFDQIDQTDKVVQVDRVDSSAEARRPKEASPAAAASRDGSPQSSSGSTENSSFCDCQSQFADSRSGLARCCMNVRDGAVSESLPSCGRCRRRSVESGNIVGAAEPLAAAQPAAAPEAAAAAVGEARPAAPPAAAPPAAAPPAAPLILRLDLSRQTRYACQSHPGEPCDCCAEPRESIRAEPRRRSVPRRRGSRGASSYRNCDSTGRNSCGRGGSSGEGGFFTPRTPSSGSSGSGCRGGGASPFYGGGRPPSQRSQRRSRMLLARIRAPSSPADNSSSRRRQKPSGAGGGGAAFLAHRARRMSVAVFPSDEAVVAMAAAAARGEPGAPAAAAAAAAGAGSGLGGGGAPQLRGYEHPIVLERLHRSTFRRAQSPSPPPPEAAPGAEGATGAAAGGNGAAPPLPEIRVAPANGGAVPALTRRGAPPLSLTPPHASPCSAPASAWLLSAPAPRGGTRNSVTPTTAGGAHADAAGENLRRALFERVSSALVVQQALHEFQAERAGSCHAVTSRLYEGGGASASALEALAAQRAATDRGADSAERTLALSALAQRSPAGAAAAAAREAEAFAEILTDGTRLLRQAKASVRLHRYCVDRFLGSSAEGCGAASAAGDDRRGGSGDRGSGFALSRGGPRLRRGTLDGEIGGDSDGEDGDGSEGGSSPSASSSLILDSDDEVVDLAAEGRSVRLVCDGSPDSRATAAAGAAGAAAAGAGALTGSSSPGAHTPAALSPVSPTSPFSSSMCSTRSNEAIREWSSRFLLITQELTARISRLLSWLFELVNSLRQSSSVGHFEQTNQLKELVSSQLAFINCKSPQEHLKRDWDSARFFMGLVVARKNLSNAVLKDGGGTASSERLGELEAQILHCTEHEPVEEWRAAAVAAAAALQQLATGALHQLGDALQMEAAWSTASPAALSVSGAAIAPAPPFVTPISLRACAGGRGRRASTPNPTFIGKKHPPHPLLPPPQLRPRTRADTPGGK